MCQALCQTLSHVIAFTSHNNPIRQGLLTSFYRCKKQGLRELTYLKLFSLQLEALRDSDAQNTYLIARRHLPVGIVVTKWAFHKIFFKVSHEMLGQKICVVT